jgi:hypothetical protein
MHTKMVFVQNAHVTQSQVKTNQCAFVRLKITILIKLNGYVLHALAIHLQPQTDWVAFVIMDTLILAQLVWQFAKVTKSILALIVFALVNTIGKMVIA